MTALISDSRENDNSVVKLLPYYTEIAEQLDRFSFVFGCEVFPNWCKATVPSLCATTRNALSVFSYKCIQVHSLSCLNSHL